MTPERWQQIREVFDRAVSLPSGKRAAYLDTVCAQDSDLRHEVESVEDMEGIGALLADDLQIGFPHVGTDEDDLRGHLVADGGEESLKGFDGSFFSDPKQARDVEIDLINQREVLMTFGILDLVDADGVDGSEFAMFQSKGDDVFHSVKNLFP